MIQRSSLSSLAREFRREKGDLIDCREFLDFVEERNGSIIPLTKGIYFLRRVGYKCIRDYKYEVVQDAD